MSTWIGLEWRWRQRQSPAKNVVMRRTEASNTNREAVLRMSDYRAQEFRLERAENEPEASRKRAKNEPRTSRRRTRSAVVAPARAEPEWTCVRLDRPKSTHQQGCQSPVQSSETRSGPRLGTWGLLVTPQSPRMSPLPPSARPVALGVEQSGRRRCNPSDLALPELVHIQESPRGFATPLFPPALLFPLFSLLPLYLRAPSDPKAAIFSLEISRLKRNRSNLTLIFIFIGVS
jgi:hypothetical protein